jgi:hypothetical protein
VLKFHCFQRFEAAKYPQKREKEPKESQLVYMIILVVRRKVPACTLSSMVVICEEIRFGEDRWKLLIMSREMEKSGILFCRSRS